MLRSGCARPASGWWSRTRAISGTCRKRTAVRDVLAPAYDLLETADDGLCCGAGGAYVVTQPELSRRILDRKVDALRAAGGANPIVASANPGCMVQLRGAGIDARHPADLIAEALDE